MQDFSDHKVWEEAHRLTLETYAATASFPMEEPYGLKSQLRRSCASVPAKIARGCGFDTDMDLARGLDISADIAKELEYHLLLARDLGLLGSPGYAKLDAKVNDAKRMCAELASKLRSG